MATNSMELLDWLRKQLESADVDLLRAMLEEFAEKLMGADRWSPKFRQYAKVAPALIVEGQEQWQNDVVSLHNSRHESHWKLFLAPTRWLNWPRSTTYTPT